MPLHRNIRLLTWFNFFSDFRPYAPVAIIYFAGITHSYSLGLAVFSIEMLSTSIFELPTGIISDMVGRRRTIIFGSMMSVLSVIFYAIGGYFWVLVIGSVFAGLARSFYSGNNQALLHDSLKEQNHVDAYAEHSGNVSSMFQIALGVSALLGGLIAYFSFPLVLWLSVIPQIICFIISLYISEPKIHDPNDKTNIYSHLKEAVIKFRENEKLRTLSIASILDYGIGESLYQFSSAFVSLLWPLWAIGLAKMLSNIGAAIGMRFSGRVTKKLGFFKSLIVFTIYGRIAGLIAGLFPSIISPLLISSTSLSYGINSIAKDTLFQREFTNKQRATMGSLNSLGASLFFAVFAYIFGMVADTLAPNQAMVIGELLLVSVLLLYWKLFNKDN
jgi:MFS family permease